MNRTSRSEAPGRASAPAPAPLLVLCLTLLAALVGCDTSPRLESVRPPPEDESTSAAQAGGGEKQSHAGRGNLTLAVVGDIHFEWHVADILARDHARALGPVTAAVRRADLAIGNLETTLTTRGTPEPKEFTFRTSPRALTVLAEAGFDVLSLANNHAADYGAVGLRDTLAAVEAGPIPVVGIGRDEDEAFRPHRARVGGTTVTVFGVHQVRGYTTWHWSAGPDTPGVAASIRPRPRLLQAVRRADRAGDLVVVYLHWGEERRSCPTALQRDMAVALARAGADVVAGSHAHVLLGAGWLGDTYVSYGLANFVWYNTYRPHSGVLTLSIRDGEVVADSFLPALIRDDGLPHPLRGAARAQAVRAWKALRGCAGLAATPPGS